MRISYHSCDTFYFFSVDALCMTTLNLIYIEDGRIFLMDGRGLMNQDLESFEDFFFFCRFAFVMPVGHCKFN